jgi:hypothetical protein
MTMSAAMDYQIAFNIALTLAAFLGGYTLSNISKAIERLDTDVRSMPIKYLSKDDYRDDLKRIEDMLGKIFDRLDGKVDKP